MPTRSMRRNEIWCCSGDGMEAVRATGSALGNPLRSSTDITPGAGRREPMRTDGEGRVSIDELPLSTVSIGATALRLRDGGLSAAKRRLRTCGGCRSLFGLPVWHRFSAMRPVSGRQQDLFELLQQLAIANEIARGVFLPHIAKHGASALEPIEIGRRRCWSGWLFRADPDQKGLRFAKGARPLDLAVVGQQLSENDARERRDLGLLRLDIDGLYRHQLIVR